MSITASDYAGRRAKVAEAAADAGLDGLLVCSRGGGTLDRFADVFYLTGFYTQFPYIPAIPGNWSGRAHAITIVAANGDTRLIADIPDVSTATLPEKHTICTSFVADAATVALRDMGLDQAKLGLVGADVLPADMYLQITGSLPGLSLVDFQAQFNRIKAVKSNAEIELLRRASDLGSRVMDVMMEAARPGRSHGEVMGDAMAVLVAERGMLYNAFIRSGSGGVRAVLTKSALPTWDSSARLEDGQFFCTGLSGVVDGYYFDLARCRPIGRAGNAQLDVFESAISIVETGMAACTVGASGSGVMQAGADRQRELGFETGGNFQGFGHGIGLGWDDPWLAPGVETRIEPDMVICVEKWLMRDGYAADFEETVLVTENGPEKLTTAKMRYW